MIRTGTAASAKSGYRFSGPAAFKIDQNGWQRRSVMFDGAVGLSGAENQKFHKSLNFFIQCGLWLYELRHVIFACYLDMLQLVFSR